MLSGTKAVYEETSTAAVRAPQFLIEPEPWLRLFLRNFVDLFRAAPPQLWLTSRPATYWPDALVNRPISWRTLRQSILAHILLGLSVYGLHLLWQNQPQVLPEQAGTKTVLHYELSEYLPPVNITAKPEPPKRRRVQKADPEYAPQEIVVLNEKHVSTKQTIVQPGPVFLKQDVPLPNLIASASVPGAPTAMNHPLPVLPVNVPQIAAPAQQVVQSSLRPLNFPPAAQPTVAAPAGTAVSRKAIQALPMESAVVIPPAPDVTERKANSLQIPVQAPPQVAPPTEAAASRSLRSVPLPMSAPQVAPPTTATATRNLSNFGLPSPDATAAPPATQIVSGSVAREKEVGQLLVLNARPVAPTESLTVPEGNRTGEFTASPSGHAGATAQPEIKAGAGSSPANIYVSAPPVKIASNSVIASAAKPPRPLVPESTDKPRDSIDNQVFGTRRNYSMRLSMPNLTSATGSWSIRFAELNATGAGQGESNLSAPEAIKKVDPAYPQELVQDRIEGTVVLYAVIHADGSVGEVRVLEGFDERLNENARKALTQWRFRPGTKDGTPVDVEAVVRVPFKVPRKEF